MLWAEVVETSHPLPIDLCVALRIPSKLESILLPPLASFYTRLPGSPPQIHSFLFSQDCMVSLPQTLYCSHLYDLYVNSLTSQSLTLNRTSTSDLNCKFSLLIPNQVYCLYPPKPQVFPAPPWNEFSLSANKAAVFFVIVVVSCVLVKLPVLFFYLEVGGWEQPQAGGHSLPLFFPVTLAVFLEQTLLNLQAVFG